MRLTKTSSLAVLLFLSAAVACADAVPVGKMLSWGGVAGTITKNVTSAVPLRGGIFYHERFAESFAVTTRPSIANLGSMAGKPSNTDEVLIECDVPGGGVAYHGPAIGAELQQGVLTWVETGPDAHRYVSNLACTISGIGDE